MDNTIIILSPEKTCTSTLTDSFAPICKNVYVKHYFNLLNQYPEISKAGIQKFIDSHRGKLHIINVFREPFDRYKSFYFQVQSVVDPQFNKYTMEEHHQLYEQFIVNKLSDDDNYYEYFEQYFGINIFNYPFDKHTKYTRIEHQGIVLHLIRFDAIDNIEMLLNKDFPNLKLKSTNISSSKKYKDIYLKFKKTYKYSTYIQNIFINKYIPFLEYFYTEHEIKNILNNSGIINENII